MSRRPAPAKINLALVVGAAEAGGRHDLATVYQRIDLCDRITVEPSAQPEITGFAGDTLVSRALEALGDAVNAAPGWRVHIDKKIPIAAGLGGGSSDAATALLLANETLERPLGPPELHPLAADLGADVPFFLNPGPQLGEGDGTRLTPVDLPQDYWVVVLLPHAASKPSTASVYAAFDARGGSRGYDARRSALLAALAGIRKARDLGALPPNDLAASPLAGELRQLGAFRADVTGAGPAVYGLFVHERRAREAARELTGYGRAWVTVPAWYG